MSEQKIPFSIFFGHSFEQMGKQSNVFHVIGIEKLSEDSRIGFFRYLQRGRERFKSKPYSIVFWVTKQFEKQLFHLAPDFHHWVSCTYDFTGFKLNKEHVKIQTVSKTKEQQISFLKIRKYLEKVVWQYEHWQEVKENNEEFLNEVISRANLFDYYVPSYCIDKNNREIPLVVLSEDFLKDDNKNFLTLLGDYGIFI